MHIVNLIVAGASEVVLAFTIFAVIFCCHCIGGLIAGRRSQSQPIIAAAVVGVLSGILTIVMSFSTRSVAYTVAFTFSGWISWRNILTILMMATGALLGGYVAKTRPRASFDNHPKAGLSWRAIFLGWLFAVIGTYFVTNAVNLLALVFIFEALPKKDLSISSKMVWAFIASIYFAIVFCCHYIGGSIAGRWSKSQPIFAAVVVGVLSGILTIVGSFPSSMIAHLVQFPFSERWISWQNILTVLTKATGALLGGYVAKTRPRDSFDDHPKAGLSRKVLIIVLSAGIGMAPIIKTAVAIFYKKASISNLLAQQLFELIMLVPAMVLNMIPFAAILILAQWRLRTSPKDIPAILLPRKIGLICAFGIFCLFNILAHVGVWVDLYGSENPSSTVAIALVIYVFYAAAIMPIGYGIGWVIGWALVRIRTKHKPLLSSH